MSPNSVLIVGKDADRAEALRAALVGFGYVVVAIATTSRFALRAAVSYAPAAVFIDVDFRCELDAVPLATALRSRFPLRVVLYSDQTPPPPEAVAGFPIVCAPYAQVEVRPALQAGAVQAVFGPG